MEILACLPINSLLLTILKVCTMEPALLCRRRWTRTFHPLLGLKYIQCAYMIQGIHISLVPPLKVQGTKKLIWARLGVSRPIYVNVDSPNLGFPYFNFLGGYQLKNTLYHHIVLYTSSHLELSHTHCFIVIKHSVNLMRQNLSHALRTTSNWQTNRRT